jgi:hypothetical protein
VSVRNLSTIQNISCALPNKIYVAEVMGSFLLDLFRHLYRNWGALHHDVVGIQATFNEVESGERSKDRSRAMQQWFHISAMIIMGSLQYDTYVIFSLVSYPFVERISIMSGVSSDLGTSISYYDRHWHQENINMYQPTRGLCYSISC